MEREILKRNLQGKPESSDSSKGGKKGEMVYNTFYQWSKGEISLPENANELLKLKRERQKKYQIENE